MWLLSPLLRPSVAQYFCPQFFTCGYFGFCYIRYGILLPPVLPVWLLWPLLRPLQNTAASSSSRVVTLASVTSVAKYCCLQLFTCGYFGLCYVRCEILLPPVLHVWLLWPLLRPLWNTSAPISSHVVTMASVTSVTEYCCLQFFTCGYYGLCYVRYGILLPPVLHMWLLWPLLRPLRNTAASSSSHVVTLASVTSVTEYCCLQFFTCGYYGLCYVRYGILLPPVLHMWLLWPLLRPFSSSSACFLCALHLEHLVDIPCEHQAPTQWNSILVRRLRRRPNIKPTLREHLMPASTVMYMSQLS